MKNVIESTCNNQKLERYMRSDFPFVVPECGYRGASEAVAVIADRACLSPADLSWIMGGTVAKLFPGCWQ